MASIMAADNRDFGGHKTGFHSAHFHALPDRPFLRSRPVTFSTVAIPLPA